MPPPVPQAPLLPPGYAVAVQHPGQHPQVLQPQPGGAPNQHAYPIPPPPQQLTPVTGGITMIPGVTIVQDSSGMIPQFLVISREKTGKCVAGSTRVIDFSGAHTTIAALVKANEARKSDGVVPEAGRALTMGHGGLISEARVINWFANGKAQLYRLETQSGRSIEATASHKFQTQRGWVALQDLNLEDDRVFVVAEYPRQMFWRGQAKALSIAALVAYCIADGYLEPHLTFTKNEDEVREDFIGALTELGDRHSIVVQDEKHSTAVRVLGVDKSKLVRTLTNMGLMGLRSGDKFIPDEIGTWSRQAVSVFLARLFTCDGSIEATGKVSYSSKSRRLVEQVQHLCTRFGIVGTIRTKKIDGADYGAELIIGSRSNVIAFADSIGMLGEKGRVLATHRAALASRTTTEGVETQLWRHGPYLLDRIESVTPTRVDEVYDIEIEEHHNFIANDFVVHNSTLGTTLVNWPRSGMHPLFFAFDESGPNSCLKLGYQPHVMKVAKMSGLRTIDKARDGLTRLEANIVNLRNLYGSIIVDCASTMVDLLHEDARRGKNPNPQSHFGDALMWSREVMHRLLSLGLPIWWLAWLREAETVEEKMGTGEVKVKKLIPGGANILGNFRNILSGKVQHIFILEKRNVGPHPAADEAGFVRLFHTRDHDNVRAGGRFSHLLPPEMPANCQQVMNIVLAAK